MYSELPACSRRQTLKRWAVSLAIVLVTAAVAHAAAVTGIVVDSEGKPVPGARVGTAFTLARTFAQTRVWISYADSAVVTDARGRFSMPAAPIAYTHVLVAAGRNGTLGFARPWCLCASRCASWHICTS